MTFGSVAVMRQEYRNSALGPVSRKGLVGGLALGLPDQARDGLQRLVGDLSGSLPAPARVADRLDLDRLPECDPDVLAERPSMALRDAFGPRDAGRHDGRARLQGQPRRALQEGPHLETST